MKILLISASPINYQISIGNTFLNIFAGMQNVDLSSIYSRSGFPDFRYITDAFQLTEKSLIKGILSGNCKGRRICTEDCTQTDDIIKDSKLEAFVKKHSSEFLYVIRNLLWKVAPWEKSGIKEFIAEINPDIIFTLFSKDTAVNDLIIFAKENSNAKLVLYAWDDHYSYMSKNPFLALKKSVNRRKMKKIFDMSSAMYVISEIQKQEYEQEFGRELKVLTKGADFVTAPIKNDINNGIIHIVYTGNIGVGRWKTLALIAQALKRVNNEKTLIDLKIYTATPMTEEMRKKLLIEGSSYLMGSVASKEITEIQNKSDILLHVESFASKDKHAVRQSFSTKIVDYLHQAKCILAVGPADVASMDYLIKNDAALTATNEAEIEEVLRKVIDNKNLLTEYGKKAWECGKRNHQIDKIQNMLYNDFEDLLNKDTEIK